MSSSWTFRFSDDNRTLREKVVGVYGLLFAANVAVWIWAICLSRQFPMMLGIAALAYSLGLRHALDADHIAAIDNVTRKFMQKGKRPIGVGLYFSLGHSTIVVGLTIAIALTTTALHGELASFKMIGGVVGAVVSSLFLFAIALANGLALHSIYATFRVVKNGGRFVEEDLDLALANRGVLGRLFRRFFRLIEQSWQMYPLGLLFGLGLDTATEVGFLGVSATQASNSLPAWQILVFPALFTAGMTLLDTTDNLLMLGAYGWASVKPVRKLYYNLAITAVSVLVAVLVGGLQALNLIGAQFGLAESGGFFGLIAALDDNLGLLGLCIVGIFVLTWVVAYGVYRARGYDEIAAVAE
ncbi:MAG: HoxN/HupN/NixA family nickel/cobalt transporter [Methylocystis sp.]